MDTVESPRQKKERKAFERLEQMHERLKRMEASINEGHFKVGCLYDREFEYRSPKWWQSVRFRDVCTFVASASVVAAALTYVLTKIF